MLQRVQTLLLLGVSIVMALVLAYFVWVERIDAENRVITFSAISIEIIDTKGTLSDRSDDTIVEVISCWYIAALAILGALTPLFSIFQFKNRLTQMKLGALNSLFMVATLAVCFFKIQELDALFPQANGQPHPAFYLPMAGLILNMIANRFIRKDEKLVKSVDRIR